MSSIPSNITDWLDDVNHPWVPTCDEYRAIRPTLTEPEHYQRCILACIIRGRELVQEIWTNLVQGFSHYRVMMSTSFWTMDLVDRVFVTYYPVVSVSLSYWILLEAIIGCCSDNYPRPELSQTDCNIGDPAIYKLLHEEDRLTDSMRVYMLSHYSSDQFFDLVNSLNLSLSVEVLVDIQRHLRLRTEQRGLWSMTLMKSKHWD